MPYIKSVEAENAKKHICAVFNNNGDWRKLASTLGVKKTTAYRWIGTQEAVPKKRGGQRRVKILDEHKVLMAEYIEQNPKITLKQLKEKFEENHGLSVSTECIRKHLDGLLFTLKDICKEPERMNNQENKIKRRDYVRDLLNFQADNMPIIYMDETNFNLFISRRQGRSKKGTRCSFIAAESRGANVHVIGCIGNMGLIHHHVRRGAFKKPEAKEFVRQCLRAATILYQRSVVLVVDNAPCHSDLEVVFDEEEFLQHQLLRLSPYSPMLNPIELAWSAFKAGVKRDLAVELPEILAGEERANVAQAEFRLQRLENIINRNVTTINVNNCARYVAHIQRFIPDALNMADMQI